MKNLIYTLIGGCYLLSAILMGVGISIYFFELENDKVSGFKFFAVIFGICLVCLTPLILRIFFDSTLYESQKEIEDIREKHYSERDRTIKLNQQLMKEIERLSRQKE